MKPLFEVGEEVILCSKKSPELNGNAVVIMVIRDKDIFRCPHCSKLCRAREWNDLGYYLDIKSSHVSFKCCTPWAESALRKKHKPSDSSFDELMNDINSKCGEKSR
jgi:hypothetical protein